MIRLATVNDLEDLVRLNRECYPEDDEITTVPRLLSVARRFPCWVLEDDGIKSCLVSEISERQPYIWSVATTPSYRGKGAAASLINEFEKHYAAEGYKLPWLHVRADNPAQKLYFDLGYRVTSVERNIYGTNKHGLVMRKRIG